MFYDGQPSSYRTANPKNLLMQFIATSTYPTDLQGTTALSWRYRDARTSATQLGLRPRAAACAPCRRTTAPDGSLGSDLPVRTTAPSSTASPGLRVEARRRGRARYRYVDPGSLEGKGRSIAGWMGRLADDLVWDLKTVGFQDPSWKGNLA